MSGARLHVLRRVLCTMPLPHSLARVLNILALVQLAAAASWHAAKFAEQATAVCAPVKTNTPSHYWHSISWPAARVYAVHGANTDGTKLTNQLKASVLK